MSAGIQIFWQLSGPDERATFPSHESRVARRLDEALEALLER